MDLMRDRSRLVDGVPTSLLDVGYSRVGLDDGWQACGAGINGSFHDAHGIPIVNGSRFPDVAAMSDKAHSQGLTIGFYMNNYECSAKENAAFRTPEQQELHMRGNAQWLAKNGFDEVKVDSGGKFNDMDWWQRELKATGKDIKVESCHQGHIVPNASWCPFQMWKTSGDPAVVGWQREMLATSVLLNSSRLGCWAYPGYAAYASGISSFNDSRTQFGVHCIMSSPLILSFDLTDDSAMNKTWGAITNKEAIAVNQQWAGSAGALVKMWNPDEENTSAPLFAWAQSCDTPQGSMQTWTYDADTSSMGVVLGDGRAGVQQARLCMELLPGCDCLALRACNSSASGQQFLFSADGQIIINGTAAARSGDGGQNDWGCIPSNFNAPVPGRHPAHQHVSAAQKRLAGRATATAAPSPPPPPTIDCAFVVDFLGAGGPGVAKQRCKTVGGKQNLTVSRLARGQQLLQPRACTHCAHDTAPADW